MDVQILINLHHKNDLNWKMISMNVFKLVKFFFCFMWLHSIYIHLWLKSDDDEYIRKSEKHLNKRQ